MESTHEYNKNDDTTENEEEEKASNKIHMKVGTHQTDKIIQVTTSSKKKYQTDQGDFTIKCGIAEKIIDDKYMIKSEKIETNQDEREIEA